MDISKFCEEYNVPEYMFHKIAKKFDGYYYEKISSREKIWQVVDSKFVTVIVCNDGNYHFNSKIYSEEQFDRVLNLLSFA